MANTFELIASSTVGVLGVASIDFTSIPSTYTDLCLLTSLRSAFVSGPRDAGYIVINTTGSTYESRRVRGVDAAGALSSGSGAGVDPSSTFLLGMPATTATASTFSNDMLYFPNYTGSTAKSYSSDSVQENNSTSAWEVNLVAGITTATSAISTIKIFASSGNLVQYSTAYLYGVKSS